MDGSTVTFYNANSTQGAISFTANITGLVVPAYAIYNIDVGWFFNFGQDSSFAGQLTAQGNQDGNGKGDFYYEPPTDYLALCSDNLSDPEIALPGEYFNTVLYTGDAATTQAVTGVGFSPGLLWLKSRSAATGNFLQDLVRGATNRLQSDSTGAEVTDAAYVASFESDGFTVGNNTDVNDNTETYVAWNWKAGGAPTADNSAGAGATPTAGSVKIDGSNLGSALAGTTAATKISANTTSGFSIVTYNAPTTATSIAHGLSSTPELIIAKDLAYSGSNWPVMRDNTNPSSILYLNLTNAAGADSGSYTGVTASTFSIGTGTDLNYDNVVAYCFHSVEGYSKIGIYEGNGDTDGSFIYTGFSPKFFLSKNIDSTQNWTIQGYYPGYNPEDRKLIPNEIGVEGTGSNLDFLSNGVKWRIDWNEGNGSYTYLYMAFAESPFKYSNAR
jgi:hypothetical protein